ncbi:MAG: hypothetical protein F4150_05405 [Chloroflexi bacterium]|nr:hypothetical protein [Chloroflexota bacterium]
MGARGHDRERRRARHRRGRPDVARRRAGGLPLRDGRRPPGRSATARPAAAGGPPAGSRRLGAGARAGRRARDAPRARALPRWELAPPSRDQRLHLRGLLRGTAALAGTGIRFIPVPHSGRSSESAEEAEAVATLVRALLRPGSGYTDAAGDSRPLGQSDVLVITPYNAQVAAVREALPEVRVGTVDKFQGQEAPVAIYSMATSSGAEAPRGMEFLYSLHRLNVATSRAQCLAAVVASPALVRVRCRTPRQMRLANALARLIEVAEERGG